LAETSVKKSEKSNSDVASQGDDLGMSRCPSSDLIVNRRYHEYFPSGAAGTRQLQSTLYGLTVWNDML